MIVSSDFEETNIYVTEQAFGMIEDQYGMDDTFDGLIGLAYPSIAEGVGTPLMDTMMS